MSTVTFFVKKTQKAVLHRKKQRIPRWNQLLLFCSVQIVLFVRFFPINKVGFVKADILCGEYGVFACLFLFFTEYIDYIFVNGIGKIYNPNNVTEAFGKLLKENGLRKIRLPRFKCGANRWSYLNRVFYALNRYLRLFYAKNIFGDNREIDRKHYLYDSDILDINFG